MSRTYEELDVRHTPLGELVLRRRRRPGASPWVYEVLLDGAFLMSSLVDVSERALATTALADVDGDALDVLVGGLGLGATAAAALDDARVRSVEVVERLPEVVAWHRDGLVPLGVRLTEDPRCRFVHGDFFARMRGPEASPLDVVLLDVDHSPRAVLHASHAPFYEREGLERLVAHLRPGGVFGLWSADAVDAAFLARLEGALGTARAETVRFFNPHVNAEDVNTIYVARRERGTSPGRQSL